MLRVGIAKEAAGHERRVAASPDSLKKLFKRKGLEVCVETGAGITSSFSDDAYTKVGAKIVSASELSQCDIHFRLGRTDINTAKPNSLVVGLLDPFRNDGYFDQLAAKKVSAVSLEKIPRTSRAQSMDVLSSQANIAGYRAVLEAATSYTHFFPIMMTSAGMAKPAKLIVLGAGVAGLQAIATARRLGAQVEAYDIRPEVKEQIESLGAKFIELDIGEQGQSAGGYAKELSEDAKKRQQELLTQRLSAADILISTANIPGRKAPVIITEVAVKGMKRGSVIVDMSAASGGNCPLTEADKVVEKHGVILVGHTNYPSMVATDASHFFGNNLVTLIDLFIKEENGDSSLKFALDDDIVASSLIVHDGQRRIQ